MSEHEHLGKAPITEAVIDLWTGEVPGGIDVLRPFAATVVARFPKHEVRTAYAATFGMREGAPQAIAAPPRDLALLCRSEDGLDIVQARIDGFSANRLRPYQDWAALKQLAEQYWPVYQRLAQPAEILRIGLRYINQFELPVAKAPLRDEELARYLAWCPAVIKPLGSEKPEDFFVQLALRPSPQVQGVVTLMTNAPASPTGVPFVFDIGFTSSGPWPANSREIWEALDGLRALKNEVFFSSITDELKERFK